MGASFLESLVISACYLEYLEERLQRDVGTVEGQRNELIWAASILWCCNIQGYQDQGRQLASGVKSRDTS